MFLIICIRFEGIGVQRFKVQGSEVHFFALRASQGRQGSKVQGSSLPWPPARSLRLGERDCFEYAWVMLIHWDRWDKSIHVFSVSQYSAVWFKLEEA